METGGIQHSRRMRFPNLFFFFNPATAVDYENSWSMFYRIRQTYGREYLLFIVDWVGNKSNDYTNV